MQGSESLKQQHKEDRKMTREIIREIERFGECFIGTVDVQGVTVFKRYNRVRREYEKLHPNKTLAYDSETGICWEV